MARNSWMTGLVAGVAAGALAGGAAGWLVRGQADGAAAPGAAPRSSTEKAPGGGYQPPTELVHVTHLPGSERQEPTKGPAESASREPAKGLSKGLKAEAGAGELFSEPLLEFADAGIRRGWAHTRKDEPTDDEVERGISMFREETLGLPEGVGHQLATRRSESELALEDARTGGVFSILKRLDDGAEGPLFEVVDSAKTFDQFFQREHGGPSLDGAAGASQGDPVPDGATLFFPAGVHRLADFGSKWRDKFPRDLTIKGAGRDATMLVIATDLSAHDNVRNLTFENCTVHANDNYLFDVRKPSMSVTVRSCRLLGWTTGAGASCLFGTEALALRVVDTEITGAYNGQPGSGKLFDVRTNGLLARFEGCSFEALSMFGGTYGGATLVFANCQTTNILDRGKAVPGHARVLGTAMNWYQGQDPNDLKRDLNDLFPRWEEELARSR